MLDTAGLYEPLESTRAEFRVIRVLGFQHGLPRCELRTVTLQLNSIRWNALSYRWGDEDAKIFILVNERLFGVRPNLYMFLLQLAQNEEHEWIFVDALCISQSDLVERAQQVSLMGDIYKRAQKVIIWIAPDSTREAHCQLWDLCHARPTTYLSLPRTERSHRTRSESLNQDIHILFCTVVSINPYWSRL